MKWSFQQIEGVVDDRKLLELDGWNAPFGRPRKDPVIKELIKSRIQTTRYPGSRTQTRHAFGTNWESTELKGRWMTKGLAEQGLTANEMVDQWTAFVLDERTCRISWGFAVSYTGYIDELELGRESEDEIAWRMKIEIDSRDDIGFASITRGAIGRGSVPADDALVFLQIWQNFSEKLKEPAIPDMSPDFLETLDNLAAAVNRPSAELNKLAGQFGEIERGTYSAIQHFRGAITGVRTALLTYRDFAINAAIDTALLVRSAESDIAWVRYQLDLDTQSMLVLDQLNQLDRRAELAGKADVSKFVTAKDGDTWESISTRASGGPDKASEIRSFNGIRYAELPTPGESYLVQ